MTEMPNSRQNIVDLASKIRKAGTDSNDVMTQRRLAEVISFQAGSHSFTVAIGGDMSNPIAGVLCMSNYFPPVGAIVWVDIKQGDALIVGDVTSGAWTTWTPALTNFPPGSVTRAKYMRRGQTITFDFIYTVSSYVSNNIVWLASLPAQPAAVTVGSAMLYMGNTYKPSSCYADSNTSNLLFLQNTSNANGRVATNYPTNWGSGDRIYANGTYEVSAGN